MICHFQAGYYKNPTHTKLEKLFKANKELSAQVALDQYIKEGLIIALKIEKKYYNRGKRLNVLGKEYTKLVLFNIVNLLWAQAIIVKKEEKEKEERARIDGNRAIVALKKEKLEVEKAEKRL